MNTLISRIRDFNGRRDWNQFHTPKNLAMGLCVESAELMEHFLWLTPEESRELPGEKKKLVRSEIADVFIYLLNLSDSLGFDLVEAAYDKLEENERKYPVEKSKGNAKKYNEL